MSTSASQRESATIASSSQPDGAYNRRWLALGVIAIAQLMVVLDTSIVNIALPSAQRALHISLANRQWVVTAYALAFGGLLLLGGRISDFIGRKRAFVIGLVGFGLASALAGAAQNHQRLSRSSRSRSPKPASVPRHSPSSALCLAAAPRSA
jgi:MFS family permease